MGKGREEGKGEERRERKGWDGRERVAIDLIKFGRKLTPMLSVHAREWSTDITCAAVVTKSAVFMNHGFGIWD